jgi:hypothetical protein
MAERRKHKRFQAPKGLFAVIGPGFTKVGEVTDISMGGLAFRYLDRETPLNGAYIDIFMIEEVFHFGKVSVKTISDVPVVGGTPSSLVTIRRCGVQFEDLTDRQVFQLENFIKNYATDEA